MNRYTFDWQENGGYEEVMHNRETSDKPELEGEIRQSGNEFKNGEHLQEAV